MNLPNRITLTRIILIPFFIAAVVYDRMTIALIVFAVAMMSDGLDGMLARAMDQKTVFGTIVDPIADKLLLVSAYICLAFTHGVPPYVVIIIISRDVILVVGAVVVYMVTHDLKVRPSAVGKMTTFFQMLTVISVLISFDYSYIIWNVAAVFTAISGVDYMIKGSRLFSENHGSQHINKAQP